MSNPQYAYAPAYGQQPQVVVQPAPQYQYAQQPQFGQPAYAQQQQFGQQPFPQQQQFGQQPQYGQQQPVYAAPMVVASYGQPAQQGTYVPPNPNMQQQQMMQVQQPQPQQQYGMDPAPVAKNQNGEERFKEGEWRDVFWAVLFIIQALAMFIIAIYYYNKMKDEKDLTPRFNLAKQAWGLLIGILAVTTALSTLLLSLMKSHAAFMIKASFAFNIGMMVIFAIICFAQGAVAAGVITVVFAALQLLWIFIVRNRIAFAAQILTICVKVVQAYPATVFIAVLSIFVQIAWMIVWVMGVMGIMSDLDNGNSSDGQYGFVGFLLLLSFYWTSQVIKNVVGVTVDGVMATWWFFAPNMPPRPTCAAFKRATTTSLGSICLGSLIVAVLRTLRNIVRSSRGNNNGFAQCILLCILACLESLIRYFNQYAYANIAIYGTTYCQAAKNTWELFSQRGFSAIVNDDIVGSLLVWSCLMVGLICMGFGALIAHASSGIGNYALWAVVGLLLGFVVCSIAMEVIESTVITCYVCYCDDPGALQQTKPEVYADLQAAIENRKREIPPEDHN